MIWEVLVYILTAALLFAALREIWIRIDWKYVKMWMKWNGLR